MFLQDQLQPFFNTQAINDEHAEKQQMAPLAEGEEEGEGVWHFEKNIDIKKRGGGGGEGAIATLVPGAD